MKEKLIIKNFGPIKNVELELGRFNVLIGDQGTGKSTAIKLLIAIINTNYREIFDISKDDDSIDESTLLFYEYLKIVGIRTYLKKETYIYFENSLIKFEYKSGKVILRNNYFNIEESINFNFSYIPSERMLVSTLSNSLFALLETESNLPILLTRFGNRFQSSKIKQNTFLFSKFIGVDYKYENGVDVIVLENGEKVLLTNASSGIQSVIPLLTVFNEVTNRENYNNLIGIEEPELNCFPETQKKLVCHFAERSKTSNSNIFLTTHSPYILTSLNNLMYAYQVGQKHKQETSKIIEEKYWVNPEEVSAYQLLTDGTCINILTSEEGMIESDKIDEVSRTLNEEFDKLMDIELVKQ